LSIKTSAKIRAATAASLKASTSSHLQRYIQRPRKPFDHLSSTSNDYSACFVKAILSDFRVPVEAFIAMAIKPTDADTTKADAKSLEQAKQALKSDPSKSEAIYKSILSKPPGTTEAATKNLETALLSLGELYRDQKRIDELANLILQTKDALSSFAKAKTAKLGMVNSARSSLSTDGQQ
jgi:hypothetical protein